MHKTEIESYINFGSSNSVVVDISLVDALGGMVRTITIYRPLYVTVEFDNWGHDEGGIYYRADYRTLDQIITDLESYIGKPIDEWDNYSRSGKYPEKSDIAHLDQNGIVNVLKVNSDILPKTGGYVLMDGYWKTVIESSQP